ncbi:MULTISPECIES: helix-turn-helix domain-containing protein [Bacillaceae]|uniref:Helix-turn-helix domain-containing protein n=1 Tax=Evansella alkalicola TaxID=745819 RepID=A0ABS6JZV4_9BACI|nr:MULTISPECIES: helix-turn-helix domain-containing protein [Bacillaceae]MBU9723993.1 helix-turn-helix domain-containing protein [Bacillus alkalicola]
MSFIDWFLLTILSKLEGQRSAGGAFHILKGKRSAQTIQDVHLFHLKTYVGSMKDLSRENFDKKINEYIKVGLIINNNDHISLSVKGTEALSNLNKRFYLPEGYDGSKYEWTGLREVFWNRLSLIVQSVTHLIREEHSFIPVTYQLETQRWVRNFLKNTPLSVKELRDSLYNELYQFLNTLPSSRANLFTNRLSTPIATGRTFDQLCVAFYEDPLYTKVYFNSIIHQLLYQVSERKKEYGLLSKLIHDIVSTKMISESAKETEKLLNKGLELEEIMQVRGLKRSTIEDHFIELAINNHEFPILHFICKKDIEDVLTIASRFNTKRLRFIKDKLNNDISYFQIRLALTKAQEETSIG